jgi:Kef-type K+ transport system membrane component KefB
LPNAIRTINLSISAKRLIIPEPELLLSILKATLVTPLAVTALLFFAALLLAEAAVRAVRVPRTAALVLAGVVIGWLRKDNPAAALMPLPSVLLEALAMVLLFEVGQRVPLAWIRRNPWLLAASIGETGLTFAAIFAALAYGFAIPAVQCAFVGVVCMGASPIVVMSVSKDLRARGQVSERALLFSTLSSVYAVLAMQILVTGYLAATNVQLSVALQPLFQLFGSFLLGALAAGVLRLYAFITRAHGAVLTIGILCCCVLLYAYAPPLGLSPILSALFFGLVVRGTDRTHSLLSHQTSETGAVLTLAYFIILGASLTWLDSWTIAAIAAAIVAVRLLAKVAANALFAVPSALRPLKGTMVGIAMTPLSSLALLLAASIAPQPGLRHAAEIGAAVVLITAILGPVMTEVALRWAGEPTRREQ